MRGQRLIDLSLNAIEIIDRNLYERTCDVRWWATDAAVVDCLQDPTADKARHASKRLKVILDAYTVYLDLWICDPAGRVVATGRPDRYPRAVGTIRGPGLLVPGGDAHGVGRRVRGLRHPTRALARQRAGRHLRHRHPRRGRS
ncbi:MAG: hypothetical protein WDN45_03890 [Caulobacteraceae bacterium]